MNNTAGDVEDLTVEVMDSLKETCAGARPPDHQTCRELMIKDSVFINVIHEATLSEPGHASFPKVIMVLCRNGAI